MINARDTAIPALEQLDALMETVPYDAPPATMPLYQKLGEDGFFIARRVAPFWLRVSAFLRSMNAERLVRVLPGVRRDPEDEERLAVDTKLARFFPLQIFHLLGYRKLRWEGNLTGSSTL